MNFKDHLHTTAGALKNWALAQLQDSPSIAGIVIGIAFSFLLASVIRSILFGITAADPVTFSGAALVLLLAALGASWVPARKAAGVQPTEALRRD